MIATSGATTQNRYTKSRRLSPNMKPLTSSNHHQSPTDIDCVLVRMTSTQTKIKGTHSQRISSKTVMSDGSDDHDDEACYDP